MAIRGILRAAALLLAAVAVSAESAGGRALLAASSKAPVMKVGFLLPFSDPDLGYISDGIRHGAWQAAQDLGLLTKIYSANSPCGNDTLTTAQTKALIKKGVQVIIGHLCSGSSLVAAKEAAAGKVPLISASSTSAELTSKGGNYFLRTCPSDNFQGKALAVRLAETGINGVKATNLLILAGEDLYAKGLAEITGGSFIAYGENKATTVTLNAASAGKIDLSTKPDAVALFTNELPDVVAALKSLKDQGYKGLLVGGDSISNPNIAAAPGAEGLVITIPAAGSAKFNAAYATTWGEEPGAYTAQAYDALHAAYLGWKASKWTKDGSKLVRAIRAVKIKEPASAYSQGLAFDENGDIDVGDGSVYTWHVVKNGVEVPL